MNTITPGIYPNISNEEYHTGPGLSSSDMKKLLRSPLHDLTAKLAPREESPAMRLGTATHCAILEPERFAAEYIQAPDLDKRTKAGKAAWAELEATGKSILSSDEYSKAVEMGEAVRSHPLAGKLFSGGVAEQSIYWEQPVGFSAILCKCRPDYVKPLNGGHVIVDLKTTRDAREHQFQKQAFWDLGYHISAAHYMTGFEAATGERPSGFIFVAVENEPPYAVNIFRAGEDFIASGQEKAEETYSIYAECVANNEWPGYPAIIQDLWLPRGAN